jgi:Sigma-70 region 2
MARSLEDCFVDYARTGSPDVLGEVFDRAAPRLMRTTMHLSHDTAQAEDAVQATFLTAIEKARTWDSSRPLLAWLHGILIRHVHKMRDRETRAPTHERCRPGTANDPAQEAADREEVALLRGRVEERTRVQTQVVGRDRRGEQPIWDCRRSRSRRLGASVARVIQRVRRSLLDLEETRVLFGRTRVRPRRPHRTPPLSCGLLRGHHSGRR